MSQRIHDPTETGLPEYSTTGTLREILEELKDNIIFYPACG
jgi:metal-dependent amidase/aminoacylase/carboxypeptidase family protein